MLVAPARRCRWTDISICTRCLDLHAVHRPRLHSIHNHDDIIIIIIIIRRRWDAILGRLPHPWPLDIEHVPPISPHSTHP